MRALFHVNVGPLFLSVHRVADPAWRIGANRVAGALIGPYAVIGRYGVAFGRYR